jgi:hypothetical protein
MGMIGKRMIGMAGIVLGMVCSVPSIGLTDEQPRVVPEQRIEILIRDSKFVLPQQRGLVFGLPTVVIVRNQDIIPHGFTSPMLSSMQVTGEGKGITAYGKGIEGFHVNPGKTLVIRFTSERQERYEFRCDLHPKMKGEIFLLEMRTA